MSLSSFKTSRLRDLDPSSREYLLAQRDLILSRKLVRETYEAWYRYLEQATSRHGTAERGRVLELGSGGGIMQTKIPRLITTDIIDIPGLDLVADGRNLPFRDGSLKAIYMTHVFHHIPECERFLREAMRVLARGGILGMIEVAATPFARFFFTRFHPEPYRPEAKEWSFDQQNSMLDSNQALSWIVFERDRGRFETLYPGFRIRETRLFPWFCYFMSGGVTKPYLIPDLLAPAFHLADTCLTPLNRFLSLHWGIILRKEA